MGIYNFSIKKIDCAMGSYSNRRQYDTEFKSQINLEDKNIKIITWRETSLNRESTIDDIFFKEKVESRRDVNNATDDMEIDFSVDEIDNIKFIIGYGITPFNLITIFSYLAILSYGILLVRCLEQNEFFLGICIFFVLILCFGPITFKAMQITLKNKEENNKQFKGRKIVIPISKVFFGPIISNRKMLNLFIKDVLDCNPNITYKRDKFPMIMLILLVFIIIYAFRVITKILAI